MASLMDLAVSLTAKTGKFSAGFKKAGKRVKTFTARIKRISGVMLKYGSIAGGVAFAIGSLMVKKSLAAIDATAKLSDRLDIATEKLQGLRHAAEITGAGAQAMDKGLGFMAKSLGEAKQGVGEAKDALKLLGISVEDILRRRPDQQFRMIADSMARLTNQSEKAYVATKLFGRGGLGLVNTLALGSKGLDEMQREAEKLGIAFNRVDASKVEAANDAMQRVKSVFVGVFNKLTIELAPFIEEIATRFVDWATEGEGLATKLTDAFKQITGGAEAMADKLASLKDRLWPKWLQSFLGSNMALAGFGTRVITAGKYGSGMQEKGVDWVNEARQRGKAQGLRPSAISRFGHKFGMAPVKDEYLGRKLDRLIEIEASRSSTAILGR